MAKSTLLVLLFHFIALFSKTCDILNYGGIADGVSDNTKAIQSAINDCTSTNPSNPLNTVRLSQSLNNTYVSGSIFLESNINFFIDDKVTLLGSDIKNTSAYPWIYTRTGGTMNMTFASLINGGRCLNIDYNASKLGDQCEEWKTLENVMITGSGTIDGNGDSGWYNESNEFIWNHRPVLLDLMWINNLTITDITLVNPPMWTLHPLFSNNIYVSNINITTTGPNTDGFDPDSCKNVTLKDSFISTGDDCIAIKSGKDEDGRLVGISTDNVTIYNMTFGFGHGISIGSEMSGNVTNVYFNDLRLTNTESGPRIKSCPGRGGMVANISYNNVKLVNVGEGIQVSQYYCNEPGPFPIFKNFYITNLTGNVTKTAGIFDCQQDIPCQNIVLNNINIQGYQNGFSCEYAYGQSNNVSPQSCLKS